jgi:hypothetical protein
LAPADQQDGQDGLVRFTQPKFGNIIGTLLQQRLGHFSGKGLDFLNDGLDHWVGTPRRVHGRYRFHFFKRVHFQVVVDNLGLVPKRL